MSITCLVNGEYFTFALNSLSAKHWYRHFLMIFQLIAVNQSELIVLISTPSNCRPDSDCKTCFEDLTSPFLATFNVGLLKWRAVGWQNVDLPVVIPAGWEGSTGLNHAAFILRFQMFCITNFYSQFNYGVCHQSAGCSHARHAHRYRSTSESQTLRRKRMRLQSGEDTVS